jgi:pimeloyl-ACP methyl ester carboxylesterase
MSATLTPATPATSEPSRALYPDQEGLVERDGVRVFYEVYGTGEPTLLFLPAWSVVHSRIWKGQVPYFGRHHRAVVFDGRGNGRSDRPMAPEAYSDEEFVGDALAVLDAVQVDRAVIVGVSLGGWWGAMLAGLHPQRVEAAVLIGPVSPLGESLPERGEAAFEEAVDTEEGWRGKWNRRYWVRDYPGFADWFAGRVVTEPHSTRQLEDVSSWIRQTTPETLLATVDAPEWKGLADEGAARLPEDPSRGQALELYDRIRCPTLVIHGDQDAVISHSKGVAVADAIGAPLVTLEGVGHAPEARYPVRTNLLIRDFVNSVRQATPRR